MGWLSVRGDIIQVSHKMTHRILNTNIPEEIVSKMPMNKKSLRIGLHRKLDTKPKSLSKNKLAKNAFRSRAYLYNTLPEKITTLTKTSVFKKHLKMHLIQKWSI